MLHSGITEIEKDAFLCSGIKDIKIPKGVTAIREWTFADCYRLTSVVLHSGITEIHMTAFHQSRVRRDADIGKGFLQLRSGSSKNILTLYQY
jgi:hypothetical protein